MDRNRREIYDGMPMGANPMIRSENLRSENFRMDNAGAENIGMENVRSENIANTNMGMIECMPIAMAYVPWQKWKDIYNMDTALARGTLFG